MDFTPDFEKPGRKWESIVRTPGFHKCQFQSVLCTPAYKAVKQRKDPMIWNGGCLTVLVEQQGGGTGTKEVLSSCLIFLEYGVLSYGSVCC